MSDETGHRDPQHQDAGVDPFDDPNWGAASSPEDPPAHEGPREAGGRGKSLAVIAGVAVAVLAAVALLLWVFGGEDEPAPPAEPPPAVEAPAPAPEDAELVQLPPLDDSDSLIRQLLSVLSDHPDVLAWLLGDDLIRHVVVAVDNVADGVSPRPTLRGLTPGGAFQAMGGEGDDLLRVHPASFGRYDAIAAAIGGADVAGLAGVIRTLMPLLNEAYAELGRPDRDFADALFAAIDRLVRAPVPEAPILLNARTLRYEFRDPRLEALDPATKHLLRFGPENQRTVQDSLARLDRELRSRLRRP